MRVFIWGKVGVKQELSFGLTELELQLDSTYHGVKLIEVGLSPPSETVDYDEWGRSSRPFGYSGVSMWVKMYQSQLREVGRT